MIIYFNDFAVINSKAKNLDTIIIDILDSCDNVLQSKSYKIKDNSCVCNLSNNKSIYAAHVYKFKKTKLIGRYVL